MIEHLRDPWFILPAVGALAALGWALRLRAVGRQARAPVEAVPVAGPNTTFWNWDAAGDRLLVPELLQRITGHTAAEFGSTLHAASRHLHPDDVHRVRNDVAMIGSGHANTINLEFRLHCSGDHHVWINARGTVTRDVRGIPVRASGTFTDVTLRVEAEEERDRLFNLSIDMLAVGGFDRFLQQLNPAWVRVLGWARDKLMSHPVLYFVHSDDQAVTEAAFRALEAGEPVHGLQNRFRCLDGSYRWLSWSSFPYPNRRVIFSVVRDITRQKEDEQRLLEYQERLRAMGNQLALVEDRERRQLADAIHDGLAQQLFGIRAQVTLLKYPEKLSDGPAVVEEILNILDATMQDARSLSFELFPPVLHEVGLEAALNWLAHQFSDRTGMECVVDARERGRELPEDMRAMAYQSVRELLANVSKHADATRVVIGLNDDGDALAVWVSDDGRGFDPDQERRPLTPTDDLGGFGLFSIRERLRSIDGSMQVDSRPGHGCRVQMNFPQRAEHG